MGIRVLVADDEELERRALKRILGGSGHADLEVLEAANGQEAVELSAQADLAFLDIRMPGLDGIEAARMIRESRPTLPLVFLTAHERFDYARSALRLRVEDFLLKPASETEVLAALERALALRGAGQATAAASSAAADAARWLAETLRAELAQFRVPEEGLGRYGALAEGRGPVLAALALRWADAPGEGHGPGTSPAPGVPAVLGAGARALEKAFALRDLEALAGAGPERVLCLVLGRTGRRPDEVALRDLVLGAAEAVLEGLRSDLGLLALAGAAYVAGPPGAALPGPAELARAAASAVSVAGRGRRLVLAPLAAPEATVPAGPGLARDGALHDRAAQRALALIEERLAEDLSLEAVAGLVGVSPSHLSRLLAKRTGMGFCDCLARIRVERAKAYLSAGSVSVKEVSLLVGFRDPAYFARVFKRFAGTSPAEYRDGNRGGQGRWSPPMGQAEAGEVWE